MGTKNAPPPTPAAVARAPACRVRIALSATGCQVGWTWLAQCSSKPASMLPSGKQRRCSHLTVAVMVSPTTFLGMAFRICRWVSCVCVDCRLRVALLVLQSQICEVRAA